MFIRNMKKMIKNKWTYLALTCGLILSIMSIIIIPMFSRASLDRLLQHTLKNYTLENSTYPLTMYYEFKPELGKIDLNFFKDIDELTTNCTLKYNLPIFAEKKLLQTPIFSAWKNGSDISTSSQLIESNINMLSLDNLEENIKLINGHMYSNTPDENGVCEVIVDSSTFNSRNFELNELYSTYFEPETSLNISQFEKNTKPIQFKIVGVFEIVEGDYWTRGTWAPGAFNFFTSKENHIYMDNAFPKCTYILEYYLDYRTLRYSDIADMTSTLEKTNELLLDYDGTHSSAITTISTGLQPKMNATTNILFIIFLPLIFMLVLYTFMISNIIAKNDSNEISLLKSRGAKLFDILSSYIVQGLLMGSFAIIIAPFLAKYVVYLLGATSNFLEFSNKDGLYPYITLDHYLLALLIIIIFILTMIVPVYILSKKSIVNSKRDKLRVSQTSLWKKYFIDIILVAASMYGFFSFSSKSGIGDASSLPFDPMIYVLVSCMCLGLCLIFLRIYPSILKLMFKLGKESWTPETYYVLGNNSRDFSKKEYILIFLIFTLAVGIFNMNSARKMNNDGIDNINYLMGSDIIISEYWDNVISPNNFYSDSDIAKLSEIDGIESASKVVTRNYCRLNTYYRTKTKIRLMAIVPDKFGPTAWMRDDLFPDDWYKHLNALTEQPYGILVSTSLLDAGFKLGDFCALYYPGEESLDSLVQYPIEGRIIGSFDYWPGWDSEKDPFLIVGNYNYVFDYVPPMPYNIWINTSEDIKSKDIKSLISDSGINMSFFTSRDEKTQNFKSDIFIQAVNASYTFAFIMTLIITFTGFTVYWILNIKDRALQFGILRALGISKFRIYKMLILEQVMSTVVAIIAGTFIGNLVFELFGSITEIAALEGTRALPSLIQYLLSDYMRVFSVVGFMIILVLVILIIYISKLKISQAIRLGED